MTYLYSHIRAFRWIPIEHDQQVVTAGFVFQRFEQSILAKIHWSIRWACRIHWRTEP